MGIQFDIAPPPSVTAYWERRAANLRPSFNHRDVWLDGHARAFTVAKAMQADVLSAIRDEVGRAIEEGRTYEQFRKDLKPTLQRLGWWGRKGMVDPQTGKTVQAQLGSPRRLKTIYWANTRTARAAGLWSRAQATKRVLPYFRYGLGPSENHRPHHESKSGIVLPVDHPFWSQWFPPNGWGCKCWVRQIGAAEAERLGGVSEPPEVPTRTYVNTRLPEGHPRRRTELPRGIDPGWHGNPGLAAERDRAIADKVLAASASGGGVPGGVSAAIAPIASRRISAAVAARRARRERADELRAQGMPREAAWRQIQEESPVSLEPFPIAAFPFGLERLNPSGALVETTEASLVKRADRRDLPIGLATGIQPLLDEGAAFLSEDASGDTRKIVFIGRLRDDGPVVRAVLSLLSSAEAWRLISIYEPAQQDEGRLLGNQVARGAVKLEREAGDATPPDSRSEKR